MVGTKGGNFEIGSPDPWKMHFWHNFWLQRAYCPLLINTIPPYKYYVLMIKYIKSRHSNRCINVGNKLPRLPCWWVILFFCNQAWQGQSVMLRLDFSFLYMGIFNFSNIFIFCTIHFSFTQLYEMPLLSSNNWAKQKPSVRKY